MSGEKVAHCLILCSYTCCLNFSFPDNIACCLALTWHEFLSVCKTAPHFAWTSTPFHLSLHGYYTFFSSFLLYCTIATYGRGELRVRNRLPTRYWGNDALSLLLWFVCLEIAQEQEWFQFAYVLLSDALNLKKLLWETWNFYSCNIWIDEIFIFYFI